MALRSLSLNLDDALYQAALGHAQREGKTLEQVLAEFITSYAATASKPAEPSPPATTPSAPVTYTVQPGDSLSKIARQVYNDPAKYPLIQKTNNLVNPSLIHVGQVLVIPPLA